MRKYLKFAMAPAIASIALLASCGKKTDSTKNSTGGSGKERHFHLGWKDHQGWRQSYHCCR